MTIQTFTYCPSYGAKLNETPNVAKSELGDGYVQRAKRGIQNNPKAWNLSFPIKNTTQTNGILTFFRNHGGTDSFIWVDPENYSSRWICEKWDTEFENGVFSNISAVFIEVFW